MPPTNIPVKLPPTKVPKLSLNAVGGGYSSSDLHQAQNAIANGKHQQGFFGKLNNLQFFLCGGFEVGPASHQRHQSDLIEQGSFRQQNTKYIFYAMIYAFTVCI
jgi:hypothetical protein